MLIFRVEPVECEGCRRGGVPASQLERVTRVPHSIAPGGGKSVSSSSEFTENEAG